MESTLMYSEDRIPSLMSTITHEMNEGKKIITKYFQQLKGLNIGDVLDSPETYVKIVQFLSETEDKFRLRYNKYYDIHESFENQDLESNDVYELGRLVSDFDTVYMDISDLKEAYSDILDPIIDNGRISNKIKYLNSEYPPETIDITPNDNNPE